MFGKRNSVSGINDMNEKGYIGFVYVVGSKNFRPDKLFKVIEVKQLFCS
jgi:hypothetical protein